mmetsp:Transcript_6154/g.8805  ORF Transcript_6154/g.8805 Transcript_6154/m.8805 type:complete len:179 (+) Transcript_6154:91-627(+)
MMHSSNMNYGNTGGINSRTARSPAPSSLAYYIQPKQRLNSLFAIHAICSLIIGSIGFLMPGLATLFFSTENDRELGVARAISRLYCALILAQGIMIWTARRINEGEIKRAFVQAYFICFLLSTIALFIEHTNNQGVVSGKLMGILKILAMICLTLGYGWFTFFQPPAVFMGLQSHHNY